MMQRMQWAGSRGFAVTSAIVAAATAMAVAGNIRASEKPKPRIVVIGGGIMGSCTAYHLAKRNDAEVTLIDAGHPIRSSWGESRIARLAYDDPLYVTMMQRAYVLWEELSRDANKQLMITTGSIDITKKGSPNMKILLETYDGLKLPYERFSTPESLAKRYPQIRLDPSEEAVFQGSGSLVLADVCVAAATECAVKFGTTHIEGDPVVQIDRETRTVHTAGGLVIPYDKLIITLGPWVNSILGPSRLRQLPLIASNEQQLFFVPKDPKDTPQYDPVTFPTIIWRDEWAYALPHTPNGTPGIKVAVHGQGQPMSNAEFVVPNGVTAETLPHMRKTLTATQSDDYDEFMGNMCRQTVEKYLPGINHTSHETYLRCLYTNVASHQRPDGSSDHDFVVGQHPDDEHVYLGTGFGGEGFKFGVFIGEMLADLASGRPASVEQVEERFKVSRLPLYDDMSEIVMGA